jgi:hypothetical protein
MFKGNSSKCKWDKLGISRTVLEFRGIVNVKPSSPLKVNGRVGRPRVLRL